MVKTKILLNKKCIKYLKQILEQTGEINAKVDHLITVIRERYYTPYNCPFANFKHTAGYSNGRNNNNNHDNNGK